MVSLPILQKQSIDYCHTLSGTYPTSTNVLQVCPDRAHPNICLLVGQAGAGSRAHAPAWAAGQGTAEVKE